MKIIAIIQARMTSQRVPGKVLAPFLGKPLIGNVVDRLKKFDSNLPIILGTSFDLTDDPLALYGESLGLCVERGSKDDVLGRFITILKKYPCDAFFRVCGDSPFLDHRLFKEALLIYKNNSFDLVTNTFPRTFPVGMSVELINTVKFLEIEKKVCSSADREHVTRFYYQNPDKFNIYNIKCIKPSNHFQSCAVDEANDFKRLEQLYESGNIPYCLKTGNNRAYYDKQ